MKHLSAKRITAMVAGAALVGIGLAFPGPISIGNIPIITNNGQPAIQVVIGSAAKPSDGVAAANIAAAIGNLAFTTSTVSPVVNTTEAQSVLHVSVSSPTYSLTNQQVWLNESASALTSGTYGFTALIGSVLNGAVQLGAPASTKTLQGTGQYSYPESTSLTTTPAPSPYTGVGYVPVSTSVTSSYNGGGATFSSFSSGTNDNILRVSSSQLPALMSGSGNYGENEYLWLTGFPVFDQASGVNSFALLDANGAYQITFNKPIPVETSGTTSNSVNNAAFSLLGQSWTIIGYKLPGASSWNTTAGASTASASGVVNGGSLQLASSLTPLSTVYVGSNLTSGNFQVVLNDLGQPNNAGTSPAALSIYYNGKLTNTSSVFPGNTVKFNVTGKLLYVKVNQTFAGLYAYEKWAKMQLYSNVYTLNSGSAFNTTTNPNWNVELAWANSTESAKPVDSLQGIVLYGTTSEAQTLLPGQSFNFITSPAVWKLEFVGETLGSANFDPVTFASSSAGAFKYKNPYTSGTPAIYNVTEPAQELTVTSTIPNAFTYSGQTSSSVVYDLTPYEVTNPSNALSMTTNFPYNTIVTVNLGNTNANGLITTSDPLLVTVTGYTTNGLNGPSTQQQSLTLTFSAAGTQALSSTLYNVSGITLNRAVAFAQGAGNIVTVTTENSVVSASNSVTVGTLTALTPQIVYTPSGQSVPSLASGSSVIYNQQNGQPTNSWTLTAVTGAPSSSTAPSAYFTYNAVETTVPTQTTTDALSFQIFNATGGVTATPFFQLNYSETGTHNNMTYFPYSGSTPFNVNAGFRTEKGSKIASITPTTLTVDFAKSVDQLQFAVAPVSTTVSKSYSLKGPYGIGQATNIPNVSIGKVTANITLSGTSGYTITGINNITANPVTTSTPVLLKSLSSTAPLAILDSQGVQNSPYILVGSGYVNSLSAALQSAYNITMTPSTQIVQAYGNRILVAGYYANQTTAAANQFINELYQQAASTT